MFTYRACFIRNFALYVDWSYWQKNTNSATNNAIWLSICNTRSACGGSHWGVPTTSESSRGNKGLVGQAWTRTSFSSGLSGSATKNHNLLCVDQALAKRSICSKRFLDLGYHLWEQIPLFWTYTRGHPSQHCAAPGDELLLVRPVVGGANLRRKAVDLVQLWWLINLCIHSLK